jgi:hypothetical protein
MDVSSLRADFQSLHSAAAVGALGARPGELLSWLIPAAAGKTRAKVPFRSIQVSSVQFDGPLLASAPYWNPAPDTPALSFAIAGFSSADLREDMKSYLQTKLENVVSDNWP